VREIEVEKLYEIAGKEAVSLENELHSFAQRLSEMIELRGFFADSGVTAEHKLFIFGELNPGASKLFRDLFSLLMEEGLVGRIPWLAGEFSAVISKRTGTGYLEVRAARELTAEERERIKSCIKEKLRMRFVRDAGLIGGIRLRWEDGRFMDASLSGMLEQMKEKLLA
jgi:F0F1-type ATP synthase delta subunit